MSVFRVESVVLFILFFVRKVIGDALLSDHAGLPDASVATLVIWCEESSAFVCLFQIPFTGGLKKTPPLK